ncbi:MAG: hypothetical protein JYX80_02420 [Candidatus Scalindua sediminis]|nr:hypothetical protein [Candidatus Scalindua sediminis]
MDSLENEVLVVRDYWHGGFFGKILRDYLWQRLRPFRELSVCEIANERHILTTEIIAIVMKNIVGPLYKCKLVSKEITDTVDLMELLLRSDKNSLLARKRQIISEVAKAIKEMHDVGIYHADLHLKNILIQPTGNGTFKVYIIDLDKSRQFGEIGLNRRRKNILRLDRSLEKFKRNASDRKALPVTNTDKMRFLREYIGTDSESKKTLKSYLKTYQTTHKLHRFWWLVMGRC